MRYSEGPLVIRATRVINERSFGVPQDDKATHLYDLGGGCKTLATPGEGGRASTRHVLRPAGRPRAPRPPRCGPASLPGKMIVGHGCLLSAGALVPTSSRSSDLMRCLT